MRRRLCSMLSLATVSCTLLVTSRAYEPPSDPVCRLTDVSPGPGSKVNQGNSVSGRMLTISATGLEGAVGPPTSWSTPNQGVIVDHIAAADKDGRLVLFYSYPGSDWKAVNIREKTNATVAIVRPESWVFPDGQIVLERLAAPSPTGDLLLFTWHTGSDWAVTNLTAATPGNRKIVGSVTAWQTPLDGKMVEHIGARGIDNHFLVFWRIAGGSDWAVVDVTAITNQLVGGSGASWALNLGPEWVESVAMPAMNNDLVVFEFRPSTDWRATNIGLKKIAGPPVHWRAPTGAALDYLAAPAPDGDLLLFSKEPIENTWQVYDISAHTHQRVNGPVTNWNTGTGESWWEHLAGRGPDDRLYVFFKPTGGEWDVTDVTAVTGGSIAQAPSSWMTSKGSYAGENVAAPGWDGHMRVFTFDSDWRVADVSLKSYGSTVYAASEMAGVWRSRDYGDNWQQMVRPQPAPTGTTTGGLDAPIALDLAVSPSDPNLVLAATGLDHRNPSLAGIYRSTDAGESWTLVHQFFCPDDSSPTGKAVQPVSQIMFAPGNPKMIYAAGGCAVAMSDNRGEPGSWSEFAPTEVAVGRRIWHFAVTPELAGEKRSGYACGDSALWYFSHSTAGAHWQWVLDETTATRLPENFCNLTTHENGLAAQLLALEPGNPDHVYLAVLNHANGPSYFHPVDGGPQGVHANIRIIYTANAAYAPGDPVIWPPDLVSPHPAVNTKLTHDAKVRFVDKPPYNGHWDPGETLVYDLNDDQQFSAISADLNEQVLLGGAPAVGDTLSGDPNLKFLDTGGLLAPRGAGEGSLWFGDFSGFNPDKPAAGKVNWENLPGPPLYWGGGSTPSGRSYVFTHQVKDTFLVFFSNRDSVHVSVGKPAAGSWHRLGGRDASESKRLNDLKNVFELHVDPHGLAVSPDFELSLLPSDQPAPYNENSELPRILPPTTADIPVKTNCHGRVWMTNDGGVYRSEDCGRTWILPQTGPHTLAIHNIAVIPGKQLPFGQSVPPALYFGGGDNADFFSLDGGKTWRTASNDCGDCDVWYTDPAQPGRLWRHPGGGSEAFRLFVSSGAPDPTSGILMQVVNYPPPPDGSKMERITDAVLPGDTVHNRGGRPIVRTLATESALPNGDYITIQQIDTPAPATPRRILLRARDSLNSYLPWQKVGPDLPPSVFFAQASGGHTDTVFYAGNETGLWRWPPLSGNLKSKNWQQIVPGGGATRATRFFVNPYDSREIYLLDEGTIRHSTNGGLTWPADPNLETALSDHGAFRHECFSTVCILNDMIFDHASPKIRFAMGLAGVFYSEGRGNHWTRLLDTRALPGRPRAAFFDNLTNPNERTLYIAVEGRGVMRCDLTASR